MVGIYGVLQAIADALKLLGKEINIPSLANNFIFLVFWPLFVDIWNHSFFWTKDKATINKKKN